MRVLHITNALGRLNSGGIGDVLGAFVGAQNNLVEQIEVWHPNDHSDSIEFAQETGIDIKQVKSFKTLGGNKVGFSPEMILKALRSRNDFDIIHQHGIWLPVSISSLLISSKKTKRVISPHGFLNKNALTISSLKKNISASLFENRNLKRAACLHACSSFEADFFRDYGLQQDIALIPNGIDDQFLQASGNAKAFKNKHKLQDQKVILFLSRIHPSKGLKLLFEVIESLKEEFKTWKLVIAGIDELNHEAELKNLAKVLNINHLIKFIGPVFGQEKVNAFDASDLFILPTDTENFGIVVAQALARKKPVITTKEAPWKDLVKYDCGWWIDKNHESLKASIKNILTLPDSELKRKGLNGYNLIKKEYLWSELAHNTVVLYKYLLNHNSKKPSFII